MNWEPLTKAVVRWECSLPARVSESTADGWRTVTIVAEAAGNLSVRGEWSLGRIADPFWCLPGQFWGDNLQDTTPLLYPRFDASLARPRAFRSSHWMIHLSRLSQPVVACHDGESWHLWETEVAPLSLGFAVRNGEAFLCCGLPPIEEPYRPTGHDYTEARTETRAMKAGESLTLRYRLSRWTGARESMLDFLRERYHEGRRRAALVPPAVENAAVARVTRNGLMRWHYAPQSNCFKYTVAYDRIGQQLAEGAGCTLDSTQMHLGWVSGWVVFEPLLDYAARFGDAEAGDAVVDVWEHLRRSATSPSGFWWARHVATPRSVDGKPLRCLFESRRDDDWDGGWLPDPCHIHLRTIGDAVLRAARVLRKHGARLPFADSLRDDVVRQARLAADLARRSPVLPLSVDALTGKPQALSGTAGVIWISVWIELMRQGLWEDRDIITRCAEAYRPFVASGKLHGAPEDVGECTSSEDVHVAINAFCDLFEQFQQPEDLESAMRAANWLYLWHRNFHLPLPPRTLIGSYQLSSVGGEFASSKNNHLHVYGLDVDESLRHLARWTNDARWTELADDHWRFSAQLISMEDGQYNGFEGMMTEQFYFLDWSCLGNSVSRYEKDDRKAMWDVGPYFRNRGNFSGFSTVWCVAFGLRTALGRLESEKQQLGRKS